MKINFDTITKAADERFDLLELEIAGETVVFGNPARLSREKRKEFRKLVDDMRAKAEDADENGEAEVDPAAQSDALISILESVCTSNNFDIIRQAIGDDDAMWAILIENYFEALKVGEASASQS